jgi:uncharacterized protein (DUF2384 family)
MALQGTKAKKKPHIKQHDVRGASFLRIAKRLRKNANEYTTDTSVREWHLAKLLQLLADAFEQEGLTARSLR